MFFRPFFLDKPPFTMREMCYGKAGYYTKSAFLTHFFLSMFDRKIHGGLLPVRRIDLSIFIDSTWTSEYWTLSQLKWGSLECKGALY